MVFSSTIFLLCFLPLTILLYQVMPGIRAKNYFLLAASLLFYSWGHPSHLLLLFVSIGINFACALLLDRLSSRPGLRKGILAVGVLANLSLLVYFKYAGFLVENINALLSIEIVAPAVVLPVGISFFTFQGLSYLIDVYRQRTEANRRIADVALYISLFPQLIAGPIVTYKDIAEQIEHRSITVPSFSAGIDRFLVGLAKKILIADVLGEVAVTLQTALPGGLDTPSAWLFILCYTFQIYFDFSAYSDMAIGICRMFGFSIMENFNYPYISSSISEFWRRWHISLSSWFREYLYIPLGGNRRGNVYFNLFIVFCATGIWHGAQWQFLLWGWWHGFFIVLDKLLMKKPFYQKVPKALGWLGTMFIVVMGWVLFSANGLDGVVMMLKNLFVPTKAGAYAFSFPYYFNNRVLVTLLLAVVGSTPYVARAGNWLIQQHAAVSIVKRVGLLCLLVVCIAVTVSGAYSPFIYFRF